MNSPNHFSEMIVCTLFYKFKAEKNLELIMKPSDFILSNPQKHASTSIFTLYLDNKHDDFSSVEISDPLKSLKLQCSMQKKERRRQTLK